MDKPLTNEQIIDMLEPLDIGSPGPFLYSEKYVEIRYEKIVDGCQCSLLWNAVGKTKTEIWEFINENILKDKIMKFLQTVSTKNYGELQIVKQGNFIIAGWIYGNTIASYFEREIKRHDAATVQKELNLLIDEIEREDARDY